MTQAVQEPPSRAARVEAQRLRVESEMRERETRNREVLERFPGDPVRRRRRGRKLDATDGGEAVSLLTALHVARRLSISRRTVWRWLALGRLPQPLRLSSSKVLWQSEEIERFLAERAAQRPMKVDV